MVRACLECEGVRNDAHADVCGDFAGSMSTSKISYVEALPRVFTPVLRIVHAHRPQRRLPGMADTARTAALLISLASQSLYGASARCRQCRAKICQHAVSKIVEEMRKTRDEPSDIEL